MSLYAAQPTRRARQVLTDAVYLLILVGAVWLALTVHDAVLGLTGPGEDVQAAGDGLSGGLTQAGDFLGGIPLIGDEIADEVAVPFDRAASGADAMSTAGADAAAAVERIAFWLGVVTAALPIVVVSFHYLPTRIRFVREAFALRRLQAAGLGPAELDLLALRALTRSPIATLRSVGDDVAERWRDRDPDVVRSLAGLELRACGVRVPPPPGAAPADRMAS